MPGLLLLLGLLLLEPASCTTATTPATTVNIPITSSSVPRTPAQGSPTSSSHGISTTSSSTSEITSVTTSYTTFDISALITPSSTTSDISAVTTPSSTTLTTQVSVTPGDHSMIVCKGDGESISVAELAGSVVVAVVLTALISSIVTHYIIRRKCSGKPGEERTSETTGGNTSTSLPEETLDDANAKSHCSNIHTPVYIGADNFVGKAPLQVYNSEARKTELDDISVIDLDHSERAVFAYNPLTMAEEIMDDSPQSEL